MLRLRTALLALPLAALLGAAFTACSAGNANKPETDGDGTTDTSSSSSAGGGASTSATGSGGADCAPAAEVCDGKDNDCNGQVDEGCDCVAGATQPCYSGPDGTSGVGPCQAGTQTCNGQGKWGSCLGEKLPAAEQCNSLDDDCNGTIDDGVADVTCGVGACAVTVPGCSGGSVPSCVPGQPTPEVCDGVDNDCDQQTDEADPQLGKPCTSLLPGVCAPGLYSCDAGALTCVPNVQPVGESCDGLDNDCNGLVDDAVPGTGGACSTGLLGVCGAGAITCQGGSIDCYPVTPASAEKCNGLDDDCNGQSDEGNPEGGAACSTGQMGICAQGAMTCQAGQLSCVPVAMATPESCNGLDDNCDGQVDEGNPGAGPCGCGGTYACQAGSLVCNGGSTVYFSDDFHDNSAGWLLDANWQIGPTASSSGQTVGGPDPAQDHTSTADNGVAGTIVGGNAPGVQTTPKYITSPVIDTSIAAGTVYLHYYRWLNSGGPPYWYSYVEVWNGSVWTRVWPVAWASNSDSAWTYQTYDITAYKSAQMHVRFGYGIGSAGQAQSGWNVDDVLVNDQACANGY